jgi:hypothetical protein
MRNALRIMALFTFVEKWTTLSKKTRIADTILHQTILDLIAHLTLSLFLYRSNDQTRLLDQYPLSTARTTTNSFGAVVITGTGE